MKFTTALTAIVAITAKVSAECAFEKLGYKCCETTTQIETIDENGTWGIENGQWCGITYNAPLKKRQWWGQNNNQWGQNNNNQWNPWGQNNNNNNQNWAANPWEQNNNNNNNNQWNQWGQNNNQGNPWEQNNNNNNNNQWNQWGQNNNQGNPWEQNNNNNNNNNQWNQWGQNQNQGNPWEQNNNNNNNQQQQNQGNSWEQNNNQQQNPTNDIPTTNAPTTDAPTTNSPTTDAPASSGDCSGKTLNSNTNLTINGRKVIVKFPAGFGSKPAPLLINFHPIMGSASQWESGSQTAAAALSDGAVVAFMDGAEGPMGQAWNVGPCCTDADDVQFTRDFIKEITSTACIDPKRIYAAGFSMGGGMSNYAGCMLSDVIAAAAPSAFDLSKEIVESGKCTPTRGFPILNFRGTQDNVVMYEGGPSQAVAGKPITFLGAQNNFKEWAKINGCTGEPTTNTPGNNCEMYENCKDGAMVGLCTINGGGHSEGDGKMGWEFLKQFSL